MEELQLPFPHSIYGEQKFGMDPLEEESYNNGAMGLCYYSQFAYSEGLEFHGEDDDDAEEDAFSLGTIPGIDDRTPFLQLLSNVESPSVSPLPEPPCGFQMLLKLQHQRPPSNHDIVRGFLQKTEALPAVEPESCVTHDASWTVESDDRRNRVSAADGVSSEINDEQPYSMATTPGESPSSSSPALALAKNNKREGRKRKRERKPKNKDEVDRQRMTHIAVERNRRRQMNDHLSMLRSLMPPSYVHRGDQASIIGGAIEFIKKLEQLLQSLQTQKRMKKLSDGGVEEAAVAAISCAAPAEEGSWIGGGGGETVSENRSSSSSMPDVRVTVMKNHANIRVECERRAGQLTSAIVALEDLRLTVLHLNVTSSETSVLYCFSLKIEDDCMIGTADEIAATVHQIFSLISIS